MNQIIPHQIPELTVDLSAHTVGFDNAVARNVNVQLHIYYVPADKPHLEDGAPAELSVEKITTKHDLVLYGDYGDVTLKAGFDLRSLMTGFDIEAIEENLLARAGGAA